VVLQQPVAAAEVAFAEVAVAGDALSGLLALLEGASDLAWCHFVVLVLVEKW
jgi:hypothetical protein